MRAAYRDRGDVASPFRRDARRGRATRGTARRGGATAASAATTARLTREQCVEYVRSGCKPRDRFRCARDDATTGRRETGETGGDDGRVDDVARVVKNLKKSKSRERSRRERRLGRGDVRVDDANGWDA